VAVFARDTLTMTGMPGFADHLLALGLGLALPAWAAFKFRRFREAARLGSLDRAREYTYTIILQWTVVATTLSVWVLSGRSFASLGLVVPGGRALAVGVGVTAAVLLALAAQQRALRNLTPERREQLRSQVESVVELLPRNRREHLVFRALAVTAGTCEEILYRGFLIWYLAAYSGRWPAVVAAGLVFGIAHLYQGPAGVLKTGLVGVFSGALYQLSGSLLWPMILHSAVDLQGGSAAHYLGLSDEDGVSGTAPPASVEPP
jgi:membrane protease YdiL (CAAX protease family)